MGSVVLAVQKAQQGRHLFVLPHGIGDADTGVKAGKSSAYKGEYNRCGKHDDQGEP